MASPTIKETAIVDKIAKNILRVPIAFVVYVVIFITMASPTIKETAIVDKIAKNILRVPAISSTTSEIFSSATHSRSAPPK